MLAGPIVVILFSQVLITTLFNQWLFQIPHTCFYFSNKLWYHHPSSRIVFGYSLNSLINIHIQTLIPLCKYAPWVEITLPPLPNEHHTDMFFIYICYSLRVWSTKCSHFVELIMRIYLIGICWRTHFLRLLSANRLSDAFDELWSLKICCAVMACSISWYMNN